MDRFINCGRVNENGERCDGVAVLEGDERGKTLRYVCKKCGHIFTKTRGRDAGVHTFNLGPGDPLRSGLK